MLVSAAMSFGLVVTEVAAMSAFGTTPGKWLMNIRLTGDDGRRLSPLTVLDRSFEVWWRGMGCGLHYAFLPLHLAAWYRLIRTGTTAWDRRLGTRVQQGPLSAARVVMAAVCIAILYYVIQVVWYRPAAGGV